jgi:hypothetical protein
MAKKDLAGKLKNAGILCIVAALVLHILYLLFGDQMYGMFYYSAIAEMILFVMAVLLIMASFFLKHFTKSQAEVVKEGKKELKKTA